MNRRKFLQLLGLTAPVAAVAPTLLLAAPEPELMWTSPVIEMETIGNYFVSDKGFPALPKGVVSGYYKYVRHAFTGGQNARRGDTLWFTDEKHLHVIPIYFKPRQPPLRGHAVAINDMVEGGYGWVKMGEE